MNRHLSVISFLCFFSAGIALAESPRIDVEIAPAVLPGGNLTLKIAVELESTDSISSPVFNADDFEILGRSTSMNIVTIMTNGRFVPKRKNVYNFMLAPKKSGNLAIKNIRVNIGGKEFTAPDKLVAVQAAKSGSFAQSRPGNSRADDSEDDALPLPDSDANEADDPAVHYSPNDGEKIQLSHDFTVHLKLSKRRAYVGEPVVAEYTLYDMGNLTRSDIKKWPTFNGFWKEDIEIPMRYDYRQELINGRMVRRALLGKFLLYPLKPGKIEVSQLSVSGAFITNQQPRRGSDPFSGFFGFRSLQEATKSSQQEFIQALPLPGNAPQSFSGGVGNFQIQLEADRRKTRVNEPITLSFAVQGFGNLHALEAPKFKLPNELEVYESKTNVQNNFSQGQARPLERSVSFDLLIIPRSEGTFEVPALEWSYFDVKSESYRTLKTQSINLTVEGILPGTQPVNLANRSDSPSAPTKENAKELRYLKTLAEAEKQGTSISTLIRLGTQGLVALNLGIFGFVFYRRRKDLLAWALNRKNQKRLDWSGVLASAEKLKRSPTADPLAVEKVIESALELLLGQSVRGLARHEIEQITAENPQPLVLELLAFRDSCQEARFKPGTKNAAIDFNKLIEIIRSAR